MSRHNFTTTSRADSARQQWQHECPELDASVMALFGRLIEANEMLSRLHLDLLDLRRGEFDVLATLRRSGEPYALSPTELYRSMMVSSGGMTNRLDRLEKAGLVQRRRNREDRRAIIVELTEMGIKKIDHILQDHVRGQEKILELLDNKERESLDNLLAGLINSMSHQEEPL
ncbi:hypothetical protein BGL48_02930 [Salinivibrio sp. SS3]|uniref:MarR family winged helix-turn-helix transcriptional regulator n=1 Tax=Salinivibrio sp. SS3 TaxID=1895021 RepID=UPI000848199C|nr:MarR family transcriptional regulator [Salinivibrio sp. BNH]ODP96450.1 hypothetical protein BGL48_02930 [Salinivibrio sp. BNH]